MRYRMGDRIKIICDFEGHGNEKTLEHISKYLGRVMTIRDTLYVDGLYGYVMEEDGGIFLWGENMIE